MTASGIAEADSVIRTLARDRLPGFSLQQAFYNSPEVFGRDIERVYLRHWLFAGPVCRIPRAGDYFLYEIAGESVIVIRGTDGSVNALLNVCRHRGSRLCQAEAGRVKRFVCPYHAWTYGTDGEFLGARHLPDGFDAGDHGLHRCHVRVVSGFIFVCLATQPPGFDRIAEDIDTFFGLHRLERAQIAQHGRHVVEANWKVVVENFSECYHCAPAHPELAKVMSYVRAFDSETAAEQRAAYTAQWEQQVKARGNPAGRVGSLAGVQHEVVRIPIREGFLTQSRDGLPVAPLMGEFREYDGGVTATQFFPFNWLVACNDYAMLPRITPLSPSQTEIEVIWLVKEGAVAGTDYDIEALTWLWQHTIEQDARICEGNQKGINSRWYRPGPYTKMETSVECFVKWYLGEVT